MRRLAQLTEDPVIVLYDSDCGFCRCVMAWAVRRDRLQVLVTVPIQSQLGAELLADVTPGERLRRAHVIRADGCRLSGGAAGAQVLSVLPQTRVLGRVARSLPRTTAAMYDLVAARRASFGRLVGAKARRRADDVLARASACTAAELERRSSSQR